MPWFRLAAGIFVACQTMLLGLTINLTQPEDPLTLRLLQLGMLAATLVVLGLLGFPLATDAARGLRQKRLSMELFFLIGILGALAISVLPLLGRSGPVYFEVVSVLLVVYSIGRAVHSHSRQRAIAAATALARQAPTARRLTGSGEEVVPVQQIEPGQRVRVLPGEFIPVDGVVVEGESLVGQAAFTGEWSSVLRQPGDAVLAATAAEDGVLVIEAGVSGVNRRVDRLAETIRTACQTPTQVQRIADRVVAIFLPLVLLTAVAAGAYWTLHQSAERGLFIALAVVLVACPCAAGLAAPLTLWQLIARLAQRGVVLRSTESGERLAQIDTAILDKTGTLAEEDLEVASLHFVGNQEGLTRRLIKTVEAASDHPAARALRQIPAPSGGEAITLERLRTVPGKGVRAEVTVNGRHCVFELLRGEATDSEHLPIEAFLDGEKLATAILQERLRDSAIFAVEGFRSLGIPVTILTGDASAAVRRAERLATVESGLTPEQKLQRVEEMMQAGQRVLFVGDGVNDAAAMAKAHASIALAHGAEVTVETADATLHGGDLRRLPEAVQAAQEARRAVRTTLLFALAYNVVGIAAAAAGWLHPILASVLMSASSAFVAWRALRDPTPAALEPQKVKPKAPLPAAATETKPFSWRLGLVHVVGLVGQLALLIPLAQLEGTDRLLTIALGAALIALLLRAARGCGDWADHFLGMLTLGGLGMNLGWWYDLDLGSAAGPGGMVHSCCVLAASLDATSLQHNSHWMYWGMLLLGIPGMMLRRRQTLRGWWKEAAGLFSMRGTLGLILTVAGMCFGMWAGAQLAMAAHQLSPQGQVLLSYGLMVIGMLAGMVAGMLAINCLPGRETQA